MTKKVRILLAEDHEITRVGIRVALSKFDEIEIIGEAEDGKKAVEATKQLAPDVVLMDIGLPELSGIDATKIIKKEMPACRVLMLTLHDSDEDVRASFGAGADGYCLKDIATPMLVLAINSIAAGAVWLDPRIAKTFLQFTMQAKRRPSLTSAQPGNGTDEAAEENKGELTPRELEVLELLAQGMSNNEIAEKLFVSGQTVKTHVRHIMEKMSVSDRTQAAVRAIKRGLV